MYIRSTETFKFFSGVFFIEPSYNASPVIKECPSHTQRGGRRFGMGGKTTGGLGDEVPQKLKK